MMMMKMIKVFFIHKCKWYLENYKKRKNDKNKEKVESKNNDKKENKCPENKDNKILKKKRKNDKNEDINHKFNLPFKKIKEAGKQSKEDGQGKSIMINEMKEKYQHLTNLNILIHIYLFFLKF